MKTLEQQLNALGHHLDDEFGPITVDETHQGRLRPTPPPVRRPTWWIAIPAAAVVLILLGIIPLLTGGTEAVPPATTPGTVPITAASPTTTPSDATPAETPSTTPPITSDAPPMVLSTAEVVGPLRFVSVAAPAGLTFRGDAEWFNNKLYSVGGDGEAATALYSTPDGHSWETETGLVLPDGTSIVDLSADATRLLVMSTSTPDVIGSEQCSQPGDAIYVNVLDSQGVLLSNTINLPFTQPSTTYGCVAFRPSDASIGPAGMLVTGSISGIVPVEAIIKEHLDVDWEAIAGIQWGETLTVEFADGTRTETLDLASLGIADEMKAFADYANQLIGSDESGSDWFGERPFAWWSEDGISWTEVDRSVQAMGGHHITSAATETGFLVSPDDGPAGMLTSGATWTDELNVDGEIHRWGSRIIVENPRGVSQLENPEDILISDDTVEGFNLYYGEMGVFGGGGGGYGADLPGEEPLFFTADGTRSETWIQPEFEAAEHFVQLIGIGDDFLVLHDWTDEILWIGTLAE